MTLVDSVDSVLVLYSYSGFPEKGCALFTTKAAQEKAPEQDEKHARDAVADEAAEQETRVKLNVMSTLSIILTLLSILLAFRFVSWINMHVWRTNRNIASP